MGFPLLCRVETWHALPDLLGCLQRLFVQSSRTGTVSRRVSLYRQAMAVLVRLLAVLQLRVAPLPDPEGAQDNEEEEEEADERDAKADSSTVSAAPATSGAKRAAPRSSGGDGRPSSPARSVRPVSQAFLSLYAQSLDAFTDCVRPLLLTPPPPAPPPTAATSSSSTAAPVASEADARDVLVTLLFDVLKHRMLFYPHALTLLPPSAAAKAAADSKSSAAPQSVGGAGTFRPNAPPTASSATLLAVYYTKEAGLLPA
jgi:hypothetical protein